MPKTYRNLYKKIYSLDNLFFAYKKSRKGKTKKEYVVEFEKNLKQNLIGLQHELKTQTYKPKPLTTFILRDPKTRKISKSDFRDRIVHHTIVNILEPIFERVFIFDSCANRKGKGTLYALQRLEKFRRKVTNNFTSSAYCLKADIKHYFQEIDINILLRIIKEKIKDTQTIWLLNQILNNSSHQIFSGGESNFAKKGMPLGNLTSQFFANVYLNEFDYFIKHKLKAKFYIRYVDDFIILNSSKEQLKILKNKINFFLNEILKIELHPDKSKIICLSNGVDFVGFKNFYYFKLPRKRTIRKMLNKIEMYHKYEITKEKLLEIFQGWQAHIKWANTLKLRKQIIKKIYKPTRQQIPSHSPSQSHQPPPS